MLTKLLKYDLKWIYKLVSIFYILAFIFSVIGRALGTIENSLIFDVTSKIAFGCAISMIVSSLLQSVPQTLFVQPQDICRPGKGRKVRRLWEKKRTVN